MGLPQLRWWDNHSWTEFTSAARTPLIVQDGPGLAYADDDLPSRRSQREQRDAQFATAGAEENKPPMTKAELISTLRQLEPPKPQQIERSQPAPSYSQADQDAQDARARQEAAAAQQQAAQEQAAREAQARAQQHAQYMAQQQAQAEAQARAEAHARAEAQARAEAEARAQAEEDPFAAFLASPSTEEAPRPARSSVNYSDAPSFPQAPAGGAEFNQQPSYMDEPQSRRSQQAAPEFVGTASRRVVDRGQQIYTPFAWIIALMPLIHVVVMLLMVSSGIENLPAWAPLGVGVMSYFASIVLAFFDYRGSIAAGHSKPVHWAWAFGTGILYLIMRAGRTNREFGRGISPVVVFFAMTAVQLASFLAVPGIIIASQPALFQAQVEQSIADDAAIVGTTLDVECPTPATQIGVQFTCVGTTETGNMVEIAVSLQRANGWIDWRVDSQIWQSGALS